MTPSLPDPTSALENSQLDDSIPELEWRCADRLRPCDTSAPRSLTSSLAAGAEGDGDGGDHGESVVGNRNDGPILAATIVSLPADVRDHLTTRFGWERSRHNADSFGGDAYSPAMSALKPGWACPDHTDCRTQPLDSNGAKRRVKTRPTSQR